MSFVHPETVSESLLYTLKVSVKQCPSYTLKLSLQERLSNALKLSAKYSHLFSLLLSVIKMSFVCSDNFRRKSQP